MARDILEHLGVALSAVAVIATAVAVAPTRKLHVMWLALLAGAGVAIWFAVGMNAWSLLAAALVGGGLAAWVVDSRLRRGRRVIAGTEILRIAAFADGDTGGNPAGVALLDAFPPDVEMQRIAADIGYSETAFAVKQADAWRVRYFAPAAEIPFCGHATIALGAALARAHGNGTFPLVLNDSTISVEGRCAKGRVSATLQSPPTRSRPASADLVATALALFGYREDDLESQLPPAIIHAGMDHLLLALRDRDTLAAMRYDLAAGRDLMERAGLVTIALVYAESPFRFHARNAFAAGGVYEDPATGAAAAALAGYLRDLDWPHGGAIEIVQGEDMGLRSVLHASIPPARGTSIRLTGEARWINTTGEP